MANLVVITFANEDDAGKVRNSLRELQKSGRLSVDDAAVVVKNAEGKIEIKNEVDTGVKWGAVGGGLLGLLLASVFFPVAGIVIGAAGGAAVGALTDKGIQKSFVKEVAESLQPGNSALFVIGRDADPNAVLAVLRNYEGKVFHTSLSPEDEESLQRALAPKH